MKSITIHNLDDDVAAGIERHAQASGLSLNKTIKKLLRKALGISADQGANDQFNEFVGVWDIEQFEDFQASVKDLRQVDPGDWE